MADHILIGESMWAALRRLTTEVSIKELEEYVHYDHIPVLREASQRLGLFVLLRRTNSESIKFIGYPGFVPKPLACKPKTAKTDAHITLGEGKQIRSRCAGLVVNPKMVGDSAFGDSNKAKEAAIATWNKYWGNGPPNGFAIQKDPDSGYYGCVMRCAEGARVFPHSRSVGGRLEAQNVRTQILEQPGDKGFLLHPPRDLDQHALSTLPQGCAYIHGDYDLYALISRDDPYKRLPRPGHFEGESHTYGKNWKAFEAFVRSKINLDMIQHGSQEHFADHTDDVVDIFCPTDDRSLWYRKISGANALDRLYQEVFRGRTPKRKGERD